jgi:hypothetical protein
MAEYELKAGQNSPCELWTTEGTFLMEGTHAACRRVMDQLEAQRREIEDLRVFIKGQADNALRMLK